MIETDSESKQYEKNYYHYSSARLATYWTSDHLEVSEGKVIVYYKF